MAITDQILGMGGGGYGNILSSVGNIAGSAGSIAKKIKRLSSKEMSVGAIRDYNTNGFLAQNSLFIQISSQERLMNQHICHSGLNLCSMIQKWQ